MKRGSNSLKILIIVSLLTLTGSSCGEGGCAGLFRSRGEGVTVTVEHVRVKEVSPVVEVKGKLVPNDKADISYPNDVRVGEVYVNIGDTVFKGDPLFRLSEDNLNSDLNFARARRTELEALIEKNNNLLRSRERMLDEGKVNQDEITRLEKEIAAEDAELERIRAEMTKLSHNLDNVAVVSPVSGVVTMREINAGSTAGAGETLIRIININPVVVSFDIEAKQSEDVAVGTPLNVFIPDLPDKQFVAKVAFINPELHRVGKTFEVWATIPNDEFLLKAGMAASTEFVSDTPKHSYVIPLSAVLSRASRPYVYKVSKGVANKASITIGDVDGQQVEVARGLERGDMVVVKGAEDLYDGADVNIW